MHLWELMQSGGITMYVLVLISVLSLAIIIERQIYYRSRSRIPREKFMPDLAKELKARSLSGAIALCDSANAPFAKVVRAGLHWQGHGENICSNAMEREIAIQTVKLEKHTSIIGTIGSTSVYIGLFGTVLGIIRAFADIAKNNAGGMQVVINGISEALVCTAAGLCVAVPAVVAYNYFVKRVEGFVTDMELSASEALDLISSEIRK